MEENDKKERTESFSVSASFDIKDLITLHEVLFEATELYPTPDRQHSLYIINDLFVELYENKEVEARIRKIALEMAEEKAQEYIDNESTTNKKVYLN